jgi:ribosomal protein S18 acetylase RimI-like enzyme
VEVRRATGGDRETLRALWREFAGTPPPWAEGGEEESFAELDRALADGAAVLAEEDGAAVGFAAAMRRNDRVAELTELYVRPDARRSTAGTALVNAVLAAVGTDYVRVSVGVDNEPARAFYKRLGFQPEQLVLRLDAATVERQEGLVFGSVHVQTDDQRAVERAVARFVPRVSASRATVVSPARNGWVAVYDEVADRDPAELRQLGRELSNVTGTVVIAVGVEEGQVVRYLALDHGRILDEYLSVPEYHGPLPPGDVVGLRANPTVMARLTGADAAELRRVARTAGSPAELPPAAEHAAELGRVLGLQGAASALPRRATSRAPSSSSTADGGAR